MPSLDVGCGYSFRQKRRGQIGLDRVKGLCDVVGDAHCLPFKSNVFNAVYLMAILEHLDNPLQCIDEVKRVCKPKALCFVEVPQITSMVKWHLRRCILEFPIALIMALKWLRRNRDPNFRKLGHKTIISESWLRKTFDILHFEKEGYHTWFRPHTRFLMDLLHLKDRSRRDTFYVIGTLTH